MSTDQDSAGPGTAELVAEPVEAANWLPYCPPEADVAAAFETLIAEMRLLQDLVTGSHPDVALIETVTATMRGLGAQLAEVQATEQHRIAGGQSQRPGRAQSLVPPIHFDNQVDFTSATVTFTRFYLGAGGAAHGGALPLVFDEFLGRIGMTDGRVARTASLKVDFRAITPLNRALQLRGQVARVEGRKVFVTGTLTDGDTLLCDAEALFVLLKPGQP